MKKCIYCGEEIQDSAKKCRFCGERIEKREEKETTDYVNTEVINIKKIWFIYKKIKSKARFKRLLRYLYLDRNRITGLEFFIGGRKIILCLLILIIPTFLINLRGQSISYTDFGSFLIGLSDFVGFISGVFGIFLLRAGIKQTINRRHDLGHSGWFTLLSMFFISIGGNINEIVANDYGWFGRIMMFISFIFVIWFISAPGTNGHNKYGDNPRNKGYEIKPDKIKIEIDEEAVFGKGIMPIIIMIGIIIVSIIVMRLVEKR